MKVLADEAAPGWAKRLCCAYLADRYYADLLGRARAELRGFHADLAEDVVQEVMALLMWHAKAAQFDRTRPLGPWLMHIIVNKARDLLRYESRQHLLGRISPVLSRSQPGPAQKVGEEDHLHLLFDRLTPKERELTRLFYLEEHSARDVGLLLGCSPEQVYRNLHRVRRKLRGLGAP